MRRSYSSRTSFQRLTLLYIVGALVALYSFAMLAQDYIPRGQPIPQSVRWVNATATGANTSASAMWTNATGNTTYHKVPVHLSAGTLGKLGKAAIKRGLPVVGWGMALRGIVDGAGWAIDELTQQVISSPGVPQGDLGPTAYCLTMAPSGQLRCSSTPGQLSAFAHQTANSWLGSGYLYSQPCHVGGFMGAGRRYNCFRPDINQTISSVAYESEYTMPNGGWPSNFTNDNFSSPPVPVSDADLGNLLKQNPQIVNAILIDPDTGAPIRTQELTDALNDLRRSLEAANGLEPGSDILPSDDYSQVQPSETQWPEFCGWATPVCDFITWFKDDGPEPEKPEVPWEIESPTDIQQTWSSGLGGGSCPSPHQFSVSLAGYTANPEFSYDPICGFANIMRPVVISLATILGVMMIAGFRSTKDA